YFDDSYEEFPIMSVDIVKSNDNTTVEYNNDSHACVEGSNDDLYAYRLLLCLCSKFVLDYCGDNYEEFPIGRIPIGPSRSVDNTKSNDNTIANNPTVKCNDDPHACSLVANYCNDSYEGFSIDLFRSINNTAVENNLCACYCDSYKEILINPSRSVNNIIVKNNPCVCSFLNLIIESVDNTIGANINNPTVECNDNLCASSFIPLENLIIESFCIDNSYKEFLDDNTTVESDIYAQDIQLSLQEKTVGIATLFQNTNTNYTFRALYTFTTKIRQHVQRKAKYASGFGKAKAALNLVINMVVKTCGHPPTKHIKLSAENNSHHGGTKISVITINPNNPNLYIHNTNMKLRSNGKTTIQQM
ncbi:14178_t:CDS:10, partial [Gigaspora margarita]